MTSHYECVWRYVTHPWHAHGGAGLQVDPMIDVAPSALNFE